MKSRIWGASEHITDLYLLPLVGGDDLLGGYHTEGDIVTHSTDGVDLNDLWAEYQVTLSIYAAQRAQLVQLFTYPVTNLIENVPQVGEASFEEASEFGEPRSSRLGVKHLQLGYDFKDYDAATRYTWKFLRDADARQIQAIHEEFIRADGRLIFRKVMEALFDNRNREAEIGQRAYDVYPLYNADGMVPPNYKGNTFDGTHNHYLVSGNAQIDSGDIEDAYEHLEEHGYGIENGTTVILMLNKTQAKEVRKFRQGVANNNSAIAAYDFIPSPNQPPMILPNSEGLLGSQPPSQWGGLRVIGSYAGIYIIEDSYIPEGYSLLFGSGGAGDLRNLVGLREHANPAYNGLRLLPGNQQRYPLVDSYYARAFGTGVRQRAGAVITQYKASGSYVIPANYKQGKVLL